MYEINFIHGAESPIYWTWIVRKSTIECIRLPKGPRDYVAFKSACFWSCAASRCSRGKEIERGGQGQEWVLRGPFAPTRAN